MDIGDFCSLIGTSFWTGEEGIGRCKADIHIINELIVVFTLCRQLLRNLRNDQMPHKALYFVYVPVKINRSVSMIYVFIVSCIFLLFKETIVCFMKFVSVLYINLWHM